MERVLFGKKIVPHHLLTYSEQVYDVLAGEIERGRWKVDDRLPGVINLAKELRFGTKTVQTAYDRLKDEGYVRTLGYRGTYLKSVRPKLKRPAGRLGILVAPEHASDPLIVWYEHILLLGARRRNLAAEVIVQSPASGADTPASPELSLVGRVDGLVSLSPFPLERRHGDRPGDLPVVFLVPPFDECAPRVSADVREASAEIVHAAVRAGHRHIVFSEDCVEPDPRLTAMQLEGYRKAMEAHGLPVDDGPLRASRRVRHDSPAAVIAHLRALTARRGATAVFAGSLGRAMAMVRVAPQAGIDIPGDLSVACIGSAAVDAGGMTRQITGMVPDFDFMADTCLDLLARQSETGRSDVSSVSVRMHLLPGHTLARLEASSAVREKSAAPNRVASFT
jgi:DNA-binding LacI/PurR family transcriptional regulator